MPIKVVIADDHALLRQGIKKVLELENDIKVIGEAANGEETILRVNELLPDILLLDINMPLINGLEVTKRLAVSKPAIKIIILTIHSDDDYVLEGIKAGAAGFLLKDIEPGMLVTAIRAVNKGESFIYPTLAKHLFGQISRCQETVHYGAIDMLRQHRAERLTFRELEVLQLVGHGMSNHEIAGKLFLSEKTVKNHLTNIFRKINVSDRTQAVIYAIKHKIVVVD